MTTSGPMQVNRYSVSSAGVQRYISSTYAEPKADLSCGLDVGGGKQRVVQLVQCLDLLGVIALSRLRLQKLDHLQRLADLWDLFVQVSLLLKHVHLHELVFSITPDREEQLETCELTAFLPVQ